MLTIFHHLATTISFVYAMKVKVAQAYNNSTKLVRIDSKTNKKNGGMIIKRNVKKFLLMLM